MRGQDGSREPRHHWWGIAARGTDPHATAPRGDERSAVLLAEQVEGDLHFAVQAPDKERALELARTRLAAVGGRDEFAPSEEELAEVVSLASGMVVAAEEARRSVLSSRARGPSSPLRPRKLPWWGVARDQAGEVMVTASSSPEVDLAYDAAKALEGASSGLCAVQASSADEALNVYEALPEGAVPASVAQPVKSRRSLIAERTVPVESDRYLVSATGMLHASEDCRFVAGRDAVPLSGRRDAVALVMSDSHGRLLADDNKRRVTQWCVYCAATS